MHLTMSSAPAFAARRALSRSLSAPAALPRVRASAGAVRTYSSALDTVKETISSEKVVVFSKSYCPYCVSVKALMTNVSVKPTVIELDEVANRVAHEYVGDVLRSVGSDARPAAGGAEMQAALQELTKQRTVPNVFIGGKHVGGNDACQALHQEGKLVPMLKAAGAL